jgi:hypothetical protein
MDARQSLPRAVRRHIPRSARHLWRRSLGGGRFPERRASRSAHVEPISGWRGSRSDARSVQERRGDWRAVRPAKAGAVRPGTPQVPPLSGVPRSRAPRPGAPVGRPDLSSPPRPTPGATVCAISGSAHFRADNATPDEPAEKDVGAGVSVPPTSYCVQAYAAGPFLAESAVPLPAAKSANSAKPYSPSRARSTSGGT